MTSAELAALLQDFYREKAALRQRHVAGAMRTSHYDFNNTYQYIVNREDAQLAWVRTALEQLGVDVPGDGPTLPVPDGKRRSVEQAIAADDARLTREFVERWAPRVAQMSHARHRKMLEVVLGEAREQQRFFEEMIEGRDDLLGRRHGNVGTGGGVLSTRWVE